MWWLGRKGGLKLWLEMVGWGDGQGVVHWSMMGLDWVGVMRGVDKPSDGLRMPPYPTTMLTTSCCSIRNLNHPTPTPPSPPTPGAACCGGTGGVRGAGDHASQCTPPTPSLSPCPHPTPH